MMVLPRGYLTTWADGNPRPAPEMGLAPVRHGPPDPSSMYHTQTTMLHPKITVLTLQATDGTMGASAQVLDQKSQQRNQLLEGNMAVVASPEPQPCHSPKTLSPPHSHAATSNPSTPSPCSDSNGSMTTGTSPLRHRLTFHRNRQPVLCMHLP